MPQSEIFLLLHDALPLNPDVVVVVAPNKPAGWGRDVLNPVGCPKLPKPVTGGPVPKNNTKHYCNDTHYWDIYS